MLVFDIKEDTLKSIYLSENPAEKITYLRALSIPYGVKVIGSSAFNNIQKISNLILPNSIERIEASACQDKELCNVNFSELKNLKIIESWAFENNCLKYVNLPSNLEHIGNNAFAFNNIEELTFNDNIQEIENNAFTSNSFRTLDLSNTHLEEINEEVFFSCLSLAEVKFPPTLTYIGICAFAHCNLSTIDIPPSVELIDTGAFRDNNITNTLKITSVNTIGALAFANNKIDTLILEDTNSLGHAAFSENALTHIDISKTHLKNIRRYSFWGVNHHITELKLPLDLSLIQSQSFSGVDIDFLDFATDCPFLSVIETKAFPVGSIRNYTTPLFIAQIPSSL